jgi:hypothetical protein
MKATLNELKSILNTLELYQDGHYYLDIQKLKQAFHPKAHIVGYYKEEQPFADRDQYLESLAAEKSSAESGESSYIKLLSLDITETTAVVKVESLIAGTLFISQLSMLKIDKNWQIVTGLFHGQENNK